MDGREDHLVQTPVAKRRASVAAVVARTLARRVVVTSGGDGDGCGCGEQEGERGGGGHHATAQRHRAATTVRHRPEQGGEPDERDVATGERGREPQRALGDRDHQAPDQQQEERPRDPPARALGDRPHGVPGEPGQRGGIERAHQRRGRGGEQRAGTAEEQRPRRETTQVGVQHGRDHVGGGARRRSPDDRADHEHLRRHDERTDRHQRQPGIPQHEPAVATQNARAGDREERQERPDERDHRQPRGHVRDLRAERALGDRGGELVVRPPEPREIEARARRLQVRVHEHGQVGEIDDEARLVGGEETAVQVARGPADHAAGRLAPEHALRPGDEHRTGRDQARLLGDQPVGERRRERRAHRRCTDRLDGAVAEVRRVEQRRARVARQHRDVGEDGREHEQGARGATVGGHVGILARGARGD
ncbi:MAG: hypothetical protein PGN13_13925 [Patulibacter minatonensis]